ncbi:putative autotransporter [Fusobacterium varium]|nr:putative autotransporter [Fusobacterium varium]
MKKNDIEKSLKRFLKRKVSYSLSLLIAFMITGGISLGAGITAEEIQETKSELLIRIQTEREEIKRKIAENERLIKEYNSDFVELVRKGDFYSKPLMPSTQVFFSYQYLDNGKMKDVTDKEFAKTIDAVNKYYGTSNGSSLLKSTGNIGKDKVMAGNGVVVDNEVFRETIEVGANIKPVEPVLPTINPNVSVNVSAPVVNLGALPGTVSPVVPSISTVTAPSITSPTAPGSLSVNVSTPSAVGKITVSAPTVTTPATPAEKNITVSAPTAPEGYDPLMIVIPSIPDKTVTVITPPVLPATNVAYQAVPANVTGYNAGGINGGLMSQLELTSGNFDLYFKGSTSYEYSFSGAAATNDGGTLPASGSGNMSVEAFYRHGGKALTTIPSNINIKVVGNNTGSPLNAVYYLGNNTTVAGSDSRLVSHAKIDMYGNKSVIANIDNVSSAGDITFINEGEITGYAAKGTFAPGKEGNATVGNFIFGGYSYGDRGVDTIENGSSGNVIFYAPGSMGWAYTSSATQNVKRSSINNGIMKLYGKNSIGVANNNNGSSTQIAYADIQLNNPIEILGDESAGVYITREPDTTSTNFLDSKFNIKLGGLVGSQDSTYGDSKGDINKVEYSVGLNYDFTLGSTGTEKILNNYKVELGSDVKDSIGIRVGTGTITFNDSNSFSQLILKGEKNIGFIADGASSKLKYDNSNKLSIDGKDQLLFASANGGNLEVSNSVSLNLADTVIGFTEAYSEGINSKVELKGGVTTTVNGSDSVLFYAKNNGIIELTESNVIQPSIEGDSINGNNTGTPKINILGKNGVIYYAKNGGEIKVDNSHAKISNGIVGVYSEDATSNIEIKNSIVDYSGNGYALYSKNNGTINASGSMIILRGTATALELDLSTPSSNPITLTGAKIVVMSNDAVGVNLKNIGALNIGTLKADIENKLGGVNIVAGTDGTQVFDKYKIAAVDGGTLNINANMDKSDTNTSSTGFFYYRRFLGQRLNLNVLDNIEVKSEINSSDAAAYFKGQVVGLEMNSSKSAASAADAQINLAAGSKVIADRTDAGAGAIGLYMNFGAVDLKAGSKIEVEKITSGGNTSNAGAVGIYAVNGSTVSNAGDIEVGGNQSIGILGMAYREDSSKNIIVNEFGTGGIFAEQGKVTIANTGNIALDGTGTIGIYADNNNTVGAVTDTKVSNTGNITVGNSNDSAAAIGIYGKKATIANQGNITVGSGGVAIYAAEGSNVTKLGTLNLGSDGIGVMVDGTSTITANSVTLTSTGADINGKTGIFYKGSGTDTKSINININASDFVKGTAVYAENMNITSSGGLNVGTEGIGIFVKGTSANTGTNAGTIDLTSGKTGAVGMYTKTANIVNDIAGIIEVRDSSQIGMYAEGANNKASNIGTINLNADSSTGIYVKSGAAAELGAGNNIVFGGGASVGVFAENAKVNFGSNLTFTNDNANKNIYVYGKDSSVEINTGSTVKVDGVGIPTAAGTEGNKTVGIYIENAGTGSTFNGMGDLEVLNGAVGIYSKGNNNLDVKVVADGGKTTGIFIDGASTITGPVTAKNDAIGVYGSGGAVTIGAGGLILNTNSGKGTGMYLADSAYAAGGLITVNNTSGTENIGVYYSRGTGSGSIINSADIKLTGTKSIGIYAADGINLVNTKNIESTTSNNIASYVGGSSILTSNGNITMTGTDSIGIYTGKGKGINTGILDVSGAAGTSSGMAAKTDAAGDTASVENTGEIKAGSNLGMYIAGSGTSSGKNTGSITVSGTGTGVYVDGSGNSFNGAGGSITSDAVGIYLKDTTAGTVTNTGTLNIASGGVGVFGENADIDFAVNVSGTGAVGVAAKGNSVISGNIKTGQGSVGAFLLNDTVTFNGAVIETGASIPESSPGASDAKTSVGILFDTGITGTYTMNNVTVNAKDGVGIYLNGTGMTLNHNGNITTENGIGIYVKSGTSLTTGTSVMNINGGTGVYVAGGTANLGTTGNLTFNFGTGGGIGVYNNGGTLVLGNNITAAGSGSLAATSNGDLTSSGNLSIGEGGTGLLGTYDSGTTAPKNITNNGGTISAHTGGIGLAAITPGTSAPTGTITINNTGIINAEGISTGAVPSPSIGIYTNIAEVVNTGTINVGTSGIGIYSADSGRSVQNDTMTMTGTDGIGVYLKGTAGGLVSNNITSGSSKNTGVVLEGVTSNINAGTIILGDESVGVMAVSGTTSAIDGTIKVGVSSSDKSAIGLVVKGGSNVTLAGTASITAGKGGIGVYAEGAAVTVLNTGNISVGTDGIYMYSKGSALTFTGDITADNQIGIVADGGSVTASGSSAITAKNGGIGAYIKNAAPTFGTTAITVQSGIAETDSSPAKYSVGIYYDGVASIGAMPTVTQTGNYTIGRILNNSAGSASGGISIGSSGSNQVGVMAKGNSNLTVTGGVAITGGNSNIGVYGESSVITVTGDISAALAASLANSSIGVFLDKGSSYTGTAGNVSAGNNSIGIYGKNMTGGTISQSGTTMNVGSNGAGIYGEGNGNINLSMGTITLSDKNSIGVYAKGLNSAVTGNMTIGTNTSIGIVSEGNGNVTYTGNMTIVDKIKTGSVGIYKLGGTVPSTITSSGNWSVGNSGYGIYLKGQGTTVNNSADMTLGMSAVGIFSSGVDVINNTGNIVVGETDVKGDHDKIENHLNSIGIYATAGTTVNNSGNITVNYDHSVGIYGDGSGTKIQNTGTINVDRGGVGILVRDGAVAVNAAGGNIILGSTSAPDPCTATTVGMAAYSGARIENAGIITVNEGVGMLIGVGAAFDNSGTIYLKNGIGIEGPGALNNYGHIVVLPGGNGTPGANVGVSNAEIGSVKIESDGTITINDKYVSIGGTLSTAGNIVVNGAYVDVTTGTPLFNANSVSGEVRLLPNFASTGNGISYEIEGFINTAMGTITGNKLTPVTSPLFIAKVTDKGNLVIAKRPYADLTIGDQFDALEKGLDNILKNSGGSGKDADILKGLNQYLEGLPADQFERETSRKLAETRGDIYSTIQGRMQDINRAFDNSFYELESSYNLTKDSSKYSVIYTDGNYKDPTLGIDDYDYKVMGVLYMKEKEGTEYGSKYGYTLGFTGSKFDFDDGGSKEDVYSLRAGVHRVKNLSEENKVSWLTRLELGYNRHIAKRKLNLQETFENKGEYNTYSVALDNRVTKVIYTDLSRQLDVYADLDLEYGKVDGFTESAGSKGGLEVQIKDNDYLSAQLGAGVKAQQRIYAGNDVSVKVTADVKYAYELGDNYDGNKARLKNGGEGYYSLITPDEREGKLTGKVGLTVEKANHMGVTFEVEAADEGNRKDTSVKYGVRFNYKF